MMSVACRTAVGAHFCDAIDIQSLLVPLQLGLASALLNDISNDIEEIDKEGDRNHQGDGDLKDNHHGDRFSLLETLS